MNNSGYYTITPRDRDDYVSITNELSDRIWPAFMLEDPVSNKHWGALHSHFPDFQFALVDRATDAIVGYANSAPLHWDDALESLPDDGWDWALEQSIKENNVGITPTLLCGLQIAVVPEYQGQGLSSRLLQILIDTARNHGFTRVIIPVRPSMKPLYPLTPMKRYIMWMREDGMPYDPWLRVHVRRGGLIIQPCEYAMRIPGAISEWEKWTGMRFFESGDYVIPGALSPVHMDITRDQGVYVEPNVWVLHEIESEMA